MPAAFFELVLGPRMKYSSCLWTDGVSSLAEAEDAMLELTARRADLVPGQRVLDLGCGWGSLTLWAAARFPTSRFVGVSNSASQRRFILERAAAAGLDNVEIVTADVGAWQPEGTFDRIVSVEMLEHVRNYEVLLGRIASWLGPEGRLFVHVFCHREHAYPFETSGATDWMGRHFFTGGQMPSRDLLPSFQESLHLLDAWTVSGLHYARSAEAWLERLDAARPRAVRALAEAHGAQDAERWLERWRVFFLCCAELFGWDSGRQWQVAHYLFAPRRDGGARARAGGAA